MTTYNDTHGVFLNSHAFLMPSAEMSETDVRVFCVPIRDHIPKHRVTQAISPRGCPAQSDSTQPPAATPLRWFLSSTVTLLPFQCNLKGCWHSQQEAIMLLHNSLFA